MNKPIDAAAPPPPATWSAELPAHGLEFRWSTGAQDTRGATVRVWRNMTHGILRVEVVPFLDAPCRLVYFAERFPSREFATFEELRATWNADVPLRVCGGWQTARAGGPCSRCRRYCAGDVLDERAVLLFPPEPDEFGDCPDRVATDGEQSP